MLARCCLNSRRYFPHRADLICSPTVGVRSAVPYVYSSSPAASCASASPIVAKKSLRMNPACPTAPTLRLAYSAASAARPRSRIPTIS
jgi:hypothetical protein